MRKKTQEELIKKAVENALMRSIVTEYGSECYTELISRVEGFVSLDEYSLRRNLEAFQHYNSLCHCLTRTQEQIYFLDYFFSAGIENDLLKDFSFREVFLCRISDAKRVMVKLRPYVLRHMAFKEEKLIKEHKNHPAYKEYFAQWFYPEFENSKID